LNARPHIGDGVIRRFGGGAVRSKKIPEEDQLHGQNGIRVSFSATAKLIGSDVSRDNYGPSNPSKVTACGLLLYKAGTRPAA
jgi:hypothetical protein